MDPSQWISAFRRTHEQARRGTLPESESKKYVSMCDELARSLMTSQGLTAPDGVPPRRAFRVPHIFPIELASSYRTMTREISCAAFTVVMGASFKEGDRVTFTLTLSRSAEPLAGFAIVKAVVKQPGNTARITCDFDDLGEERSARLETALFDAALSRIGG